MAIREELRELIPEVQMISNRALREQTLDVWAMAMEQAGWEIEDLEQIPFTLLIEDTSVGLLAHTRAVTQTAVVIGDLIAEFYAGDIPINRDYLIAGGILHDVGKLLEYKRKGKKFVKSDVGRDLRHPFSGTAVAYQRGLPSDICHMIAVHAKEGDGGWRSVEANIIHHADFVNFESLKNR
jgi:putative nucleotidyltransferase with HDIG domain